MTIEIELAYEVTTLLAPSECTLVTSEEYTWVQESATGLHFSNGTPIEVWGALVERLTRQHKRIEWASNCGKIVGRKSPRCAGNTRGRHQGVSLMPRQYTPRVDLICAQCEAPFTRPRKKAEGARFCGRACYYADRRQQDTRSLFWAKVEKTARCWLWTGSKADGGYGKFRLDGRLHPAHRVAYQWLVGPIPDGMHLDHLCRVTNCVRPIHLEPVPPRINLLRGIGPGAVNARKVVCNLGHPLSGDNLYVWRGNRGCRLCRNARSDAHHARQRAARAGTP